MHSLLLYYSQVIDPEEQEEYTLTDTTLQFTSFVMNLITDFTPEPSLGLSPLIPIVLSWIENSEPTRYTCAVCDQLDSDISICSGGEQLRSLDFDVETLYRKFAVFIRVHITLICNQHIL